MEVQQLIAAVHQQRHQLGTNIPGGIHMDQVILPCNRPNSLQGGKLFFQHSVVRLRGQLQDIASFALQLLAQLLDGTAGNQLARDKDPHTVTDLLDLIQLVLSLIHI